MFSDRLGAYSLSQFLSSHTSSTSTASGILVRIWLTDITATMGSLQRQTISCKLGFLLKTPHVTEKKDPSAPIIFTAYPQALQE